MIRKSFHQIGAFITVNCFLIINCGCSQQAHLIQDGELIRAHAEKAMINSVTGYAHYLIYDEGNRQADSTYLSLAKKYIDTVKRFLPVSEVFFVNTQEMFSLSPEDQDWEKVRSSILFEVDLEFPWQDKGCVASSYVWYDGKRIGESSNRSVP